MSTTYHVGIAIDPTLRMSDRKIDGILSDDSGRAMSPREIRLFLQGERAKGYSVFCGCDNRNSEGSCAGHKADAEGMGYQPKGSQCTACKHRNGPCSHLPFDQMPVCERLPDGTRVVICSSFERRGK